MAYMIKVILTTVALFVGGTNVEGIITLPEAEEPPTSLETIVTVEFEPYQDGELKEIKKEVEFTSLKVCDNSSFASYMDYRTITNTNSEQYKLQEVSKTNEKGYRTKGDKVLIAVHSRYGKVGDELKITFVDNHTEHFIIGDIKSSKQTNCSHPVGNGESSIIEIIVDTNIIKDRRLGKILDYSKVLKKIEKTER